MKSTTSCLSQNVKILIPIGNHTHYIKYKLPFHGCEKLVSHLSICMPLCRLWQNKQLQPGYYMPKRHTNLLRIIKCIPWSLCIYYINIINEFNIYLISTYLFDIFLHVCYILKRFEPNIYCLCSSITRCSRGPTLYEVKFLL